MSLKFAFVGLLSFTALSIPTPSQAQKPRTDTLYPVTAEFRCPTGVDCYTPERTDRFAGDSLGPLTGTVPPGMSTTTIGTASNQGAYLTATYGLQLIYKPGRGRFFALDFSEPMAPPPCAATANCRRRFDTIYADTSTPPGQVIPVDGVGRDLTNGFYGITVGQTVAARFWLNFPDPTASDVLWTLRFVPSNYPGSTWLAVTRTGVNTWTVEATAADTVALESVTTSGKSVKIHEGTYRMPFKITITR